MNICRRRGSNYFFICAIRARVPALRLTTSSSRSLSCSSGNFFAVSCDAAFPRAFCRGCLGGGDRESSITSWVARCRAWFTVVVPGLGRRGFGGGDYGGGSGLGGCWLLIFCSGAVDLMTLVALQVAGCLPSLSLVIEILVLLLWWTVFVRSGGVNNSLVIFTLFLAFHSCLRSLD